LPCVTHGKVLMVYKCWQRAPLTCAFYRVHGKGFMCLSGTAKKGLIGRRHDNHGTFAVCPNGKAHGKDLIFAVWRGNSPPLAHDKSDSRAMAVTGPLICRVPGVRHLAKNYLCHVYFVYRVSYRLAYGRKLIFPCVFCLPHVVLSSTRQKCCLSCALTFDVCFTVGIRQSFSFPCARYIAHSKSLFTRQISCFR